MGRRAQRATTAALVAVVVGGIGVSCGGGESCPAFTPCGGDVVGTWEIQNYCVSKSSGSAGSEDCPQASISISNFGASGTVTYRQDGTFTSAVTPRGTLRLSMPTSCLGPLSCMNLNALLKEDLDEDAGTVSCSGTSTCTCTFVVAEKLQTESGRYRIVGNQLIEGSDDPVNYCVAGDQLTVQSVMTMMNNMMSSMGGAFEEPQFTATAIRK